MAAIATAPQEYYRPRAPLPLLAPIVVPIPLAAGQASDNVTRTAEPADTTAFDDWTAGATNAVDLALTAWIGGLLLLEVGIATRDPRGRYLPPTLGF